MANIIKFSAFLEKKQKSETSKLLKKNGIGEDVNKQNNRGWSPLMRAVLYEEAELVKILINAGANLDLQNKCKDTALIIAAYSKSKTQIAKTLIDAGANLDLQDKNGYTALIKATLHGNTDIVKMLINAGADRTLKNKYKKTAFDYISNNQEILDIFDAYNEEYTSNYNK